MGGVWCKADNSRRPYGAKGPLNTTISRWTDNVRQVYRKPKHHHRPPRPPQKPARSNERLTISAPTLVREASSDGWRSATLVVPETQAAPVPPPRKKRKRNGDLNRSAVSMDDLARGSPDCLSQSTLSLPEKCSSDTSDSRTSVVTPVLESRLLHSVGEQDEENKENVKNTQETETEEEDREEDIADHPEIIPIEKETLYTSRTLLHSNLGYVDKLSAISEVSAESGFEDKTDVLKFSEGSGSVNSVDSEASLNILAHIRDIRDIGSLDMREKTAVSKKEWLQNILREDSEPYLISGDVSREFRRGSSDGVTSLSLSEATTVQPNSLPDRLPETRTSAPETVNKTSSPPEPHSHPENGTNHSILLDIIKNHKESESESKRPNFLDHREESIFLTDTKTNIIYKSLSSDNLTDDYDTSYSEVKTVPKQSERHNSTDDDNQRNRLTSKTHLSDYSFQTPKLVESDSGLNSLLDDKRSNIVSSFDFREMKTSKITVTDLRIGNSSTKVPSDVVNGVEVSPPHNRGIEKRSEEVKNNDKTNAKETLVKKDSISSSRKSSITDSLHEFEMSIYDMLKESKKTENSSDEDESLKIVK